MEKTDIKIDQLNPLDRKILLVLQNYPLEPYSTMAEKLGTSTQTLIRRVNSLKKRDILSVPLASFVPERLQLTRFLVTFDISSLHQYTLLQMAFSSFDYIRSYNRFYGEKFGMVANFDMPEETKPLLLKFLDHLVEQEYCDSYEVDKATGYRVSKPEPLPRYTKEPEIFDIVGFWEKRKEKAEDLPRLPSAVNLDNLEPLHFLLLQDLTTHFKNGEEIGIRTKQTTLIKHYKNHFIHLGKKISLTEKESLIFENLREFFDTRNEHHIKVDFGRKYYNVVRHHLITNPRWNFSRKLFEQHVSRAYIIKNVPNKDKAQLFRLFHEETPPFQTGFELLNNGIFLRFTIPPYLDTKLNYIIWHTFKDYQICSLDFFGKHGMYYPFQLNNMNMATKYWKVDEDWILNKTLASIDEKLKNNSFGDVKMANGVVPEYGTNGNGNGTNGSYLYKHTSNGNPTATTP